MKIVRSYLSPTHELKSDHRASTPIFIHFDCQTAFNLESLSATALNYTDKPSVSQADKRTFLLAFSSLSHRRISLLLSSVGPALKALSNTAALGNAASDETTHTRRLHCGERMIKTTIIARNPSKSASYNGPCRNRTYNLAIKSRLLCQLS